MDRVILFGKGRYLKNRWNEISSLYEIEGILDNSVKDIAEDNMFGCKIYNPKLVAKLPKYQIIITSSSYIEMWKQLKELGVEDDRIIIWKDKNIYSQDGELVFAQDGNKKYFFKSYEELNNIRRRIAFEQCKDIKNLAEASNTPYSRNFGCERGVAVDRYYIESFLRENKDDIHGDVLEIETDKYTKKYGADNVHKSYISHVLGWDGALKVNFETGEGVCEEFVDCLICTQTLQYIFNLESAMNNIVKLLRHEGVALITVPGIKSLCTFHDNQWGEYWSFTKKSIKKLCENVEGKISYEINSFGNVKVTMAYLYGLCCEDLNEEDFQYNDEQYPFIVTLKLKKI